MHSLSETGLQFTETTDLLVSGTQMQVLEPPGIRHITNKYSASRCELQPRLQAASPFPCCAAWSVETLLLKWRQRKSSFGLI